MALTSAHRKLVKDATVFAHLEYSTAQKTNQPQGISYQRSPEERPGRKPCGWASMMAPHAEELEFNPQVPQGGRREPPPASSLTSTDI